MTSSGKPVYSNYGSEDELINIFSFLQAVISVVSASNDEIKSLVAGRNKIVFLFRKSLYFIIVSHHNEPENALFRQLNFLYQNILLILTSKVHSMIENNPAIDLTSLLGSDADRILNAAGCDSKLTPIPVAFNALPQIYYDRGLKEEINSCIKQSVEKCGAA